MLDAVLKNKSVAFRISVKGTIAAVLVVLAVGLPQIAHIAGGVEAGSVWMPMYAPALLAGCLLGWGWGLGVGILAPIFSFGFTTLALGNAMPALARLPYMILELAAFGAVSGAFAKLIRKNAVYAFPAVIAAEVAGRAIYAIYSLIAGRSFAYVFASVQSSLTGLALYAVAVPLIVLALSAILSKTSKNE